MIKGLFRLLLFVVAVVLIYNYFFGDAREKQASEQIVQQVKDLGKSIGDVLLSEKDKIKEGKYDEALDKIGDFIQNLRSNSDSMDVDDLRKLNELERKKLEMEKHIQDIDKEGARSPEEEKKLRNEWEDLMKEMEDFIESQK